MKKLKWEKEFTDLASAMDDLFHIGEKYVFNGQKLKKLKIKVRKGAILIERIK